MKKVFKKVSSVLIGAALSVGVLVMAAFAAESSIAYEGGAEKFVFLPGSEYTDTDLFQNFKGVMPGDSIEQKITVQNDYKGCDYVKIYMRAVTHDEVENPLSPEVAREETVATMTDFLGQLSMTIYNGEKKIYEASPDELDGLKDNVLLGSFDYGESVELTVKLDVPIELGNKYAYRVGEVDWVFVAEHRDHSGGSDPDPDPGSKPSKDPTNPSEPERDLITILPEELPLAEFEEKVSILPATGDTTVVLPYIILLGVGIGGMLLTLIKRRKKEQE